MVIQANTGQYTAVALFHLKWALESANPLILEQPLKRTIEDNLFLLFFLSGWTKNKWIRTFQWQKATVKMIPFNPIDYYLNFVSVAD